MGFHTALFCGKRGVRRRFHSGNALFSLRSKSFLLSIQCTIFFLGHHDRIFLLGWAFGRRCCLLRRRLSLLGLIPCPFSKGWIPNLSLYSFRLRVLLRCVTWILEEDLDDLLAVIAGLLNRRGMGSHITRDSPPFVGYVKRGRLLPALRQTSRM